ncbi:MAG TPA: tetratricopeptide repeat protein [Bryobacteraceae bacterium]|nr:tetratricopeptide repeat protein [Bryobacteraceae bacterium]
MPARWWIGAVALLSARAQAPAGGCDFEAALRHHRAGEFQEAAAGYQACVASDPGRVDARSNLGAVLAAMGRYEEAIAQYQAALAAAPAEIAPNLRFNLGLAYYKSFRIRAAADEFEALSRMQPRNLNLALLLADCRLRLGEFDQAIAAAAPLDAEHAGEPALDYVLGMALIRAGRIQEGQVRVNRILGRGETAEGHFLLGSAAFASGDYPGAVKELERAAELNPDVPSLQSYLGQALLFTGDAEGAAQAFRKELAADPNDFDANFQLAQILARRGAAEEARKLLARAVEVRPGSEEARAALAAGFHFDAPPSKDPGVAAGAKAPAIGALHFEGLPRPVALVFGSYTCPKLRSSAADLKRLAERYGGRVDFRLVYIREAHAGGGQNQWQSTINQREGIDLAPARTAAEKKEHAALCLRKLELPFALTVDGMDAAAERAYAAWPSRLYLVGRDGKVAYETRLGELDFRAEDVDRAIRAMLDKR